MRRASILPLALLLVTSAVGQQAVVRSDTNITWRSRPTANDAGCPIGLLVKHGPGLAVNRNADGPTVNGKNPGAPAQPTRLLDLQLTMTNLSTQSIVHAQFIVRGFSDKWRYIPLADASHAPDLATTVDVALDVKGNGQASHSLSLSRFTAITAVDVNAIAYADGASWHTSYAGACSATPDLVMPVNAER